MIALTIAFDRFNRKERNFLIRSALSTKGDLLLAEEFCQRIGKVLNLDDLLPTAWWATDYHLSWIAGALAVYMNDTTVTGTGRPNAPSYGRRVEEGNQQDIDLLIVSGQNVILIEAKGYSIFDNKQLTKKLARLNVIFKYYNSIKKPGLEVKFHFVLAGPENTSDVAGIVPDIREPGWPDISFVPLTLPKSRLLTTRCLDNGKSSAAGNNWRVIEKVYKWPNQET